MYGVIGEKLGHSFSKEIHESFNLYKYNLIELKKEELAQFFKKKEFDGINVTIPYKREVIKYLDEISPTALKINAVNTIVKHNDKLYGYNTDYIGVIILLRYNHIDLNNKKILILGTGGTSNTVKYVCDMEKPKMVLKVSRHKQDGCITYDELDKYSDVDIIINTTPCGMYPNDESPVDLDIFTNLEAVVDIVYNPLNTHLVRDAKKRGIKSFTALLMLVGQAVYASTLFKDVKYDYYEKSVEIYHKLLIEKQNIVLIGMPGSGKSTIGNILSKELNKDFIDTDILLEEKIGKKIKDFLNKDTEPTFRNIETKIINEVSFNTNKIISTGGGVIKNSINMDYLKRNGFIIFINRDINNIVLDDNRPLSKTKDELYELYNERISLYKKYADLIVDNNGKIEEVVKKIMEEFL